MKTTLLRRKIDRIARIVQQRFGIDTVLLVDRYSIDYLFAEAYSLPEGALVLATIVDCRTLSTTALVYVLDFYRIRDLYSDCSDILRLIPVARNIKVDVGVETVEDWRSWIKKRIEKLCLAVDKPQMVQDVVKECRGIVDISNVISTIRRIKMPEEIERIAKAYTIACRALEATVSEISKGMTEQQIAGILEAKARELGAEGFAFSTIVAIGENSSYPHHIPTTRRFNGDEVILIDFGVRVDGYSSDVTRVLVPSKCSEILDKVRIVSEAIDHALRSIAIGKEFEEIDKAARSYLEEKGFSPKFIHGLGHGIGVYVHEEPRVAPGSKQLVVAGDVFTIEPGIYLEHRFGIRIEEGIAVTLDGVRVLSSSLPRTLEV